MNKKKKIGIGFGIGIGLTSLLSTSIATVSCSSNKDNSNDNDTNNKELTLNDSDVQNIFDEFKKFDANTFQDKINPIPNENQQYIFTENGLAILKKCLATTLNNNANAIESAYLSFNSVPSATNVNNQVQSGFYSATLYVNLIDGLTISLPTNTNYDNIEVVDNNTTILFNNLNIGQIWTQVPYSVLEQFRSQLYQDTNFWNNTKNPNSFTIYNEDQVAQLFLSNEIYTEIQNNVAAYFKPMVSGDQLSNPNSVPSSRTKRTTNTWSGYWNINLANCINTNVNVNFVNDDPNFFNKNTNLQKNILPNDNYAYLFGTQFQNDQNNDLSLNIGWEKINSELTLNQDDYNLLVTEFKKLMGSVTDIDQYLTLSKQKNNVYELTEKGITQLNTTFKNTFGTSTNVINNATITFTKTNDSNTSSKINSGFYNSSLTINLNPEFIINNNQNIAADNVVINNQQSLTINNLITGQVWTQVPYSVLQNFQKQLYQNDGFWTNVKGQKNNFGICNQTQTAQLLLSSSIIDQINKNGNLNDYIVSTGLTSGNILQNNTENGSIGSGTLSSWTGYYQINLNNGLTKNVNLSYSNDLEPTNTLLTEISYDKIISENSQNNKYKFGTVYRPNSTNSNDFDLCIGYQKINSNILTLSDTDYQKIISKTKQLMATTNGVNTYLDKVTKNANTYNLSTSGIEQLKQDLATTLGSNVDVIEKATLTFNNKPVNDTNTFKSGFYTANLTVNLKPTYEIIDPNTNPNIEILDNQTIIFKELQTGQIWTDVSSNNVSQFVNNLYQSQEFWKNSMNKTEFQIASQDQISKLFLDTNIISQIGNGNISKYINNPLKSGTYNDLGGCTEVFKHNMKASGEAVPDTPVVPYTPYDGYWKINLNSCLTQNINVNYLNKDNFLGIKNSNTNDIQSYCYATMVKEEPSNNVVLYIGSQNLYNSPTIVLSNNEFNKFDDMILQLTPVTTTYLEKDSSAQNTWILKDGSTNFPFFISEIEFTKFGIKSTMIDSIKFISNHDTPPTVGANQNLKGQVEEIGGFQFEKIEIKFNETFTKSFQVSDNVKNGFVYDNATKTLTWNNISLI